MFMLINALRHILTITTCTTRQIYLLERLQASQVSCLRRCMRTWPQFTLPRPTWPLSFDRNPVDRDPVDRNPLYRNPLYRNPLYRNPFYRDPLYRNPFYRDPVDRNSCVHLTLCRISIWRLIFVFFRGKITLPPQRNPKKNEYALCQIYLMAQNHMKERNLWHVLNLLFLNLYFYFLLAYSVLLLVE
jgi:hypothetical protein